MYQVAQLKAEAASMRDAVRRAAPYRPLMVKIKLLWDCNLACEMCDYWRKGGPNELSYERVTNLLIDLTNLGCLKVHFSGGEPLLRPDLVELIAFARKLKLRVTLTTNGILLTRQLAKQFVKAGLNSACISIDSPDKVVHDRMRGVRGAFKQTTAGVRQLRRAAIERGVRLPVRINTVVCRYNYHTLDKLPDLVHSLGAQSLLLMPVDDPSGNLLLNKRRLYDYNERIAPRLAEQALAFGLFSNLEEAYPFGITHPELNASRNGNYARGLFSSQPCYAPWLHSLVTADGRVAPCCSAPRVILGNLTDGSFPDIWQGKAYTQLRAAMRDGKPLPHCSGCDVFLQENRILHSFCSV